MFATEDFAAFFDSDLPGYAEATLAGGVIVGGLFRNNFAEFAGMAGTRPALLVPPDVTVAEGDALTLDGTAYRIEEIRPGEIPGTRRLILTETA